jgi:hypothetical protein
LGQIETADLRWIVTVDAAKEVIEKEGWRGLFGRGLITRYVANGLQGILFSVLWKLFSDL